MCVFWTAVGALPIHISWLCWKKFTGCVDETRCLALPVYDFRHLLRWVLVGDQRRPCRSGFVLSREKIQPLQSQGAKYVMRDKPRKREREGLRFSSGKVIEFLFKFLLFVGTKCVSCVPSL